MVRRKPLLTVRVMRDLDWYHPDGWTAADAAQMLGIGYAAARDRVREAHVAGLLRIVNPDAKRVRRFHLVD